MHQSVSLTERVEEVLHLHESDLLLDTGLSCYLTLCLELSPEHKLLGQLESVAPEFNLSLIKKDPELVIFISSESTIDLSLLQELL